ncbi:YadA-like family protein [Bartonella schoenbuchensis]|uniref:Surface protein/Bartonella adhesin n=1 Tax=Bartonella schoenbuchensis m07a TaxID=1094496 RepID=N6UFP8_9HYPH|nr:YadA-like family protein [Bartonella schoenbuchensis]ENN91369.1 surface protein/Bartonella adhesin [Bartonella schoenbuchensis m07a]
MKKVHIAPKDKSFIAQRSSSEVSLVRAVSLGAVMATLLSSVSPVFASHLSSTGSTVQSVSAGVVSAKGGKAGSGRAGVANGGRSCGVDQVISRSSSRSGKKISAKEQYKKLSANQLSDGSGSYSFESGCGADALVDALTSTRARFSIDVDAAASDWFLEENNTVNWSVNTRSVNTTGARVARPQMSEGAFESIFCGLSQALCIGQETGVGDNKTGIALGYKSTAIRGPHIAGYDPVTGGFSSEKNHLWQSTFGELGIGDLDTLQSRQITGVAAGREDNEAVNVAQLKALRKWVETEGGTWQLSVNGSGTIKVTSKDKLGLAGDENIKITNSGNTVKFGLAENVKLKGVEIGSVAKIKLDDNGIDAANKKLTGLADGKVDAGSTDAVSGNQLYKVGGDINKYLGGGADVLKGTAPEYNIQGRDRTGVADAFAGVDEKLTELFKQIGGVTGNNLVEQDPLSHIITIGKKVDGGKISILNNEGKVRTLVGLADGQVTQDSKEAVNGGQLYEMNTTIAQYFGGGADVLNGIAPTFTVINFGAKGENGKQTYNNVADAFGAINTSMSGLSDRIEKIEQQTGSQVNSDGLSWNNDKGAYSASHNDQGVNKITDIKDGTIAQGSTDAVTGHQLWSTNKEIDSLKDKVDNIVINGGGALTDGAVIYDKDKDNTITLAGTDDNTPVLIDNVADGEIEEGSKQAVNGGQLKKQMSLVLADANKYTDERIEDAVVGAVAQANAYTDMKFEALNYRVEGVQKEARQAAAIGLAVANLHYIETPGMLSIAFGSGVWRGQSALAFGTGYMSEDGKMRSNFSVTTSGGHWGVGAGLSLALK